MTHGWREVAVVAVDPSRARVHEQGWQTFSPSTEYRLDERPHRPVNDENWRGNYRPTVRPAPDAFWGEGLLGVDPGGGAPVVLVAGRGLPLEVPSIRGDVRGDRVVVSADGEVDVSVWQGRSLRDALREWARAVAPGLGAGTVRQAPTTWCSWYQYYVNVTEEDVDENLQAMDDLDLPVDVVQLDDGYQTAIGDWLSLSGRFASLPGLVRRVADTGRRSGIWCAPFLVGAGSQTALRNPEWLARDPCDERVVANHGWGADNGVLDVTHPEAAAWLHEVFSTFRGWGVDFYKIDFLFAGALDGRRHEDVPGVDAYRRGLELIRDAVGPDAYLLGCGAPIFPSVGLVDAMRVSPDISGRYEPEDGDLSQPGQRSAALTGSGRQFLNDVFWVNDPDCLIARPGVERREQWAAHVEATNGLVSSSDRLLDLDAWGLETTRRLLQGAHTQK